MPECDYCCCTIQPQGGWVEDGDLTFCIDCWNFLQEEPEEL